MSRIEQYFTSMFEPFKSAEPSLDSFMICPSSYFRDMNSEQFRAAQQIYKSAYEKAWAKVYGDEPNDFSFGSGI